MTPGHGTDGQVEGRTGKRLVLGFADQGVSSLTNVLLVISVARVSSPGDYGAFALCLTALVFTMSIQRNSLGTLFKVRGVWHEHGFGDVEARTMYSLSLAYLLLGLTITVSMGYLTGALGSSSTTLWLLVVFGQLIMLQDVLRCAALAYQRPGSALLSDLTWLAAVAVPLMVDVASDAVTLTAFDYTAAWLLGLVIGLAVLVLALRAGFHFRGAPAWVAGNFPDLWRLLAQAALAQAVPIVVATLTATYLSLNDTGALRGAQLLIGPLALLFTAVRLVVVPELVRNDRDPRLKRLGSAVVIVVAVGWGGVLSLIPDSVGRGLLGETWTLASVIIPITALEYVVYATAVMPQAVLEARSRFGRLLVLRSVYTTTSIALVSLALLTGDLRNVAWALVTSAGVLSVLARRRG